MYIVNCIWPVTSKLACLIDGQLVFFFRVWLYLLAEGFVGVIEMRIFYASNNDRKNMNILDPQQNMRTNEKSPRFKGLLSYHTHPILSNRKMEIDQVPSRTVNIIILGQCIQISTIVCNGLLVEVYKTFKLGINMYF